jgi:hypothetical protein
MNLLSVGSLADKGLYFLFGKNEVVMLNSQFKVVGLAKRDNKNGLYKFPVLSNPHLINELKLNLDDSILWHQRLGHINQKSLRFMSQQGLVSGLPKLKPKPAICKACQLGKQCRAREFPRKVRDDPQPFYTKVVTRMIADRRTGRRSDDGCWVVRD